MDQINAPILMAVDGLICFESNVPGMERTMYALHNLQVSFTSSAMMLGVELTDVEACQCERELL
jgi:hypothetical protein